MVRSPADYQNPVTTKEPGGLRDYEVRTCHKDTGEFRGWVKIADLPTHALYWLRDCNWDKPAPMVEGRNEATRDDIRLRVEIELAARALEGRL